MNFSPVAEVCSSIEDAVLRLMCQANLKIPADFVNKALRAAGHQIKLTDKKIEGHF
jgi:hypothetical protein